jgi:hypothetical protein
MTIKLTFFISFAFVFLSCRSVPVNVLSGIKLPSVDNSNTEPERIHFTPMTEVDVKNMDSLAPVKSKAPIDGYSYIANPAEYLEDHPQKNFILNASTEVAFKSGAPESCELVSNEKVYFDHDVDEDLDAQEFPVIRAAEIFANTVHQKAIFPKAGHIFMELDFYKCSGIETRKNPTSSYLKSKSTFEVDWLMGAYIDRTGFLKQLGKTGPTAGINLQFYNPKGDEVGSSFIKGLYLHFSIDHFFDTDSKFLKPKFNNEDYTNYLWSFGWSGRYLFSQDFQMNYLVGPAINFLEIDTNRYNSELTDDEATRTTISLTHQVSFHYRVENLMKVYGSKSIDSDTLIGLNFLYYWMPDALGDFAANNSSAESYGGGSLAVMFSLKFQRL